MLRTAEFQAITQELRLRKSQTQGGVKTGNEPRVKSTFSLKFKDVSSRILYEVNQTQEKLDTLASLVSKRGLYDDNPTEIQGYTKIIKENLPLHKDEIKVLQEIVRQGSNGESQNHLTHAFAVVKILGSKWNTLSKDFKAVLEMRSANMKKARERREMFAFGGSAPPLVPDDMPSIFGGLAGPRAMDEGGDTALDMPDAASEQTMALIQNDSHIQERAEAMTELEGTIMEVQDIFIEMAGLINQQGEDITRIDENVESAESSVVLAGTELQKALKNIQSNKWLMMKIAGILMAFFIIFIVVFA